MRFSSLRMTTVLIGSLPLLAVASSSKASPHDEARDERVAPAKKKKPTTLPNLSAQECTNRNGKVTRLASFADACKGAGFTKDVCVVDNPSYDPKKTDCTGGSSAFASSSPVPVPQECVRELVYCIR